MVGVLPYYTSNLHLVYLKDIEMKIGCNLLDYTTWAKVHMYSCVVTSLYISSALLA